MPIYNDCVNLHWNQLLIWKSESKIKSVIQVAYGTDSLHGCEVNVCLQKKTHKVWKNNVERR